MVLTFDICTRYLTSQIICSWKITVSRKLLCKYCWKLIYILSLIIINTTYIICIACIHQTAARVFLQMMIFVVFVKNSGSAGVKLQNLKEASPPCKIWEQDPLVTSKMFQIEGSNVKVIKIFFYNKRKVEIKYKCWSHVCINMFLLFSNYFK